MLQLASLACLCFAALAVSGGDGPLLTRVFERDPASGEQRAIAGAQLVLLESPRLSAATPSDVRIVFDASGKRVALLPPQTAITDANGVCGFRASALQQDWEQVAAQVFCFKLGFVPRALSTSEQSAESIELVRGETARLLLRVPPEIQPGASLNASVQFALQDRRERFELGSVPLPVQCVLGVDGSARIELELSGFERANSTAVLRVDGFDALRFGPSSPPELSLRPQRCLELRVCDWQTGEPIEGVRPTLRFGEIDAGGYFQPPSRHTYDQRSARRLRDALLHEPRGSARELCTSVVLLPDEAAAQITNLAHPDFLPTIYLAQGGPACRDPLTILAPDSGDGICTLYLRRWR
jgi:hypothetical protein